ncbi:MAG TPA: hypothetical protein VMD25_12615 [Acidobacteriaceae bacterium]|nr:hypothetical protein [Acidobacteriaceae bacterium]
MAKAALVDIDLKKAGRAVSALENSGVPLAAALWVHFPEYEDWRLVLASKRLDSLGPREAYLRVNRTFDQAGMTVWDTPSLFIMKTTDPFVRDLRRVFGKAANVEGLRLGGQTWGDRYIDDAYALKIA